MSSSSSPSNSANPQHDPSLASAASRSNPISRTAASKPLASSSTSKMKRRVPTKLFTPLMQEAQARNKDPYSELLEDGSDVSMDCYGDEKSTANGHDTFEGNQKKRGAACILDNPELIIMHSLARGDSIPGTRNFLMKMMCGYCDPDDNDGSFGPPSEKDEERMKLKPWGKDFDRQGRDWDSGNWGIGTLGSGS